MYKMKKLPKEKQNIWTIASTHEMKEALDGVDFGYPMSYNKKIYELIKVYENVKEIGNQSGVSFEAVMSMVGSIQKVIPKQSSSCQQQTSAIESVTISPFNVADADSCSYEEESVLQGDSSVHEDVLKDDDSQTADECDGEVEEELQEQEPNIVVEEENEPEQHSTNSG